jgi:hypothetical protein
MQDYEKPAIWPKNMKMLRLIKDNKEVLINEALEDILVYYICREQPELLPVLNLQEGECAGRA